MISNLKLGIANKKIAPLLQKKTISEKEGPVEKIGLVLDLAGIDMLHSFLNLKKDLNIKDEDFHVIGCFPSANNVENFEGVVFTPAGISWTGKIKDEEVKKFLNREFDLLISYNHTDNQSENKALNFIIGASTAGLKVGRVENGPQLYNLAISTRFEDVGVFIEELKKYLKILNKID